MGPGRRVREHDVRLGRVRGRVRSRPNEPGHMRQLRHRYADVRPDRYLAEQRILRRAGRLRSDHDGALQHVRIAIVQPRVRLGHLLVRLDAGLHTEREAVLGNRLHDV
jgi:hypothetical protein